MTRKLPKGEETLPIAVTGIIKRRFVTPSSLGERVKQLPLKPASKELLIERVSRRIAQGRESSIYRFRYELTPQQQLAHMKRGDKIGLELLDAERKLLEEELRILRE